MPILALIAWERSHKQLGALSHNPHHHEHKGVTVSNSRRTTAVALGAVAALTLLASGCSKSEPSESASAESSWMDEEITLTLATFNNFGYSDEFLDGFEALYPNVTVNHTIAATSNDARANFFTKLGAGSGLADVEAVEIDWFAEMMQYSRQARRPFVAERRGPLDSVEV